MPIGEVATAFAQKIIAFVAKGNVSSIRSGHTFVGVCDEHVASVILGSVAPVGGCSVPPGSDRSQTEGDGTRKKGARTMTQKSLCPITTRGELCKKIGMIAVFCKFLQETPPSAPWTMRKVS